MALHVWFCTIVCLLNFNNVEGWIDIDSFEKAPATDFSLFNNASDVKVVYFNDSIYAFGGRLGLNISTGRLSRDRNIYKYDYNEKKKKLEKYRIIYSLDIPFVCFHGSVLVDAQNDPSNSTILYMFGVETDYSYPGLTWRYNFDTNTVYKSIISMNTEIIRACTTYDIKRNYIYVIGGQALTDTGIVDEANFLQIFDVTEQSFLTLNGDKSESDDGHDFVEFKSIDEFGFKSKIWGSCAFDDKTDKIYYFGGYNADVYISDSILVYDIANVEWFELDNSLEYNVLFMESLKIGRHIWLFGGIHYNLNFYQDEYLKIIQDFDLDTGVTSVAKNNKNKRITLDNRPLLNVAGKCSLY